MPPLFDEFLFQPHDDPDPRLVGGLQEFSGRYHPGGYHGQETGPWGDRDGRMGDASEPENRFESPQAQQLLERARELKQRPFWNPYNRDGAENAGMDK